MIYFISLIIAFLITNGIGNKKNDSVNVLIIVICNMIILILGFKNKKIKYGIISLQNNLNNEYIELLILTISVGILFIGIIFSNKIIVSINNYFCIFINNISNILWNKHRNSKSRNNTIRFQQRKIRGERKAQESEYHDSLHFRKDRRGRRGAG